jgi:hypothetical protein
MAAVADLQQKAGPMLIENNCWCTNIYFRIKNNLTQTTN